MTAYVYRCYDADNVLLYVGCTLNPHRRVKTHLRSKRTLASHALQTLMDRYEVSGPFASRELAAAAERMAIEQERPLLNRQHTRYPGWMADRDFARYLDERGIPLEQVGLRLCEGCGMLRSHHMAGACAWCPEQLVSA